MKTIDERELPEWIKFAPYTFFVVPNKDYLEKLSIYAKWIYITLCYSSDKYWVTEIPIQKLAEKNKCWRDSIIKWLKELEDLQLIKKYKKWKNKKECFVNFYQIQILDYIADNEWYVMSEVDMNDVVVENDSTNNNIYNNNTHIINNNDNIITDNYKPVREKKNKVKEEEIFTLPTREEIYIFMWEKKWVEKFCDILQDVNLKQSLTLEQVKDIYDWIVEFFKEKYSGKIYVNRDNIFIWGEIILNELDKFISHYSENQVEIKNLKARMRKWITNSTIFNQK